MVIKTDTLELPERSRCRVHLWRVGGGGSSGGVVGVGVGHDGSLPTHPLPRTAPPPFPPPPATQTASHRARCSAAGWLAGLGPSPTPTPSSRRILLSIVAAGICVRVLVCVHMRYLCHKLVITHLWL